MKVYEFNQIDVQRDSLRLLKRPRKEKLRQLSENSKYKQQIDNFISVMGEYNIPQASLTVGDLYCPLDMAYSLPELKVHIITAINVAEYLGEQNGRLRFRYTNTQQEFLFPADGHESSEEQRVVLKDKAQLDTVIQQFIIQFSNSDWDTEVYGYNPTDGQLGRITNI